MIRFVDATRLFLDMLDDLEARVTAGASEYALLRAAGLIRELLLDEAPVIYLVNRSHQVPLRFRVRVKDLQPGNAFELFLGLDPAVELPDTLVHVLDLKHFLATPVARVPNAIITIRGIVTLAANVRGGTRERRGIRTTGRSSNSRSSSGMVTCLSNCS